MGTLLQTLTPETMRPVYKFVLIVLGVCLALSGKSHIGASGVASGIRNERAKERATQEELDTLMMACTRLCAKGDLRFALAAICLFFGGEI